MSEGVTTEGYVKAAGDPSIPVITKDDYIEWLEQQMTTTRKKLAKVIKNLGTLYGEMP